MHQALSFVPAFFPYLFYLKFYLFNCLLGERSSFLCNLCGLLNNFFKITGQPIVCLSKILYSNFSFAITLKLTVRFKYEACYPTHLSWSPSVFDVTCNVISMPNNTRCAHVYKITSLTDLPIYSSSLVHEWVKLNWLYFVVLVSCGQLVLSTCTIDHCLFISKFPSLDLLSRKKNKKFC